MEIKIIEKDNIYNALELIWEGFNESIAPLYKSPQGIETFKKTLISSDTLLRTEFIGAYKNNDLLGVIATREKRSHICYFFTHKSHKGEGIGTALFNYLLDNTESDYITVNASPYATEIYHKLGFKDLDKMQEKGGMLFTPMKYLK